ncbi:UPF0149 family protein [Legionella impletisoli]|nr:YecA family protein [Legionella impletisoli]
MSASRVSSHLPKYQTFIDSISSLDLPISGSELHGMMCGYLSAGATHKGEEYFRALMLNKDDSSRAAILALFDVYAVSQQQISNLDFEFQLMLPEEDESLSTRAQAFSEWCDGFIQGLVMAGVDVEQIEEEEVQDAIQHIAEFAKLDYDSLNIDEEDERALMEVSEYARMAVLRIYGDLKENHHHEDATQKAH